MITFTDMKEVEYGTKDYDVKKELIKEIKNCELSGDVPKLDTTKVGETKLVFTLSKSDVTKEVEHTIKIVDTKAPEITLEADSKELTVGDEYDIKTNITSVKNVVDGDISFDDKVSEINKKATEEYTKLREDEVKFKDVNGEAKFADHKLDDFFIETTRNEESGEETTQLFLKNCYYINGSVDVATAGEYTMNVVAVDKNRLKTVKEFTITVKEKEVEKPIVSNGNNGGSSSSNGGGTVQRGSKQDIVNTALAQVGKPYQLNANGPNAFDCEGLIWYAYTQNGWNIPQHVFSGGTTIPADQLQPGDIIRLPNKRHVMLYIGNDQVVQALNPQQGINITNLIVAVGTQDSNVIRY